MHYIVSVREIYAKSVLRKRKKIDSWFLSHYGMNLYRGCTHNCVYCDGRAEGYYVEGEFGKDVEVKVNAPEIIARELDPKRKRLPFKPSYVMVGGSVGDSYQPVEKTYKLTRKILLLLYERKFPVHVLTKSTLVERDIDIIKKINTQNRAIVSFSFSSINDDISAIFEPGVPSPTERLRTIQRLKGEGIACGMFLLPVIPFVTDTSSILQETITQAHDVGVDFIIFGGMTLKEGKQQAYFLNTLKQHYPHLLPDYHHIYKGDKWGNASGSYYQSINRMFYAMIKHYHIPARIPPYLYADIVDENDRIVVILEHLDYLLKLRGQPSPYGYAAYAISQLPVPVSQMIGQLQELKGIGNTTAHIIREILETGTSSYYEKLLRG